MEHSCSGCESVFNDIKSELYTDELKQVTNV